MLFDAHYQSVNKRKNYEDQVMKTVGKPDSNMIPTGHPDEIASNVQILQFTDGKKENENSSEGVSSQ
jgi:hypothetical protein